jgi:hypothetical protein
MYRPQHPKYTTVKPLTHFFLWLRHRHAICITAYMHDSYDITPISLQTWWNLQPCGRPAFSSRGSSSWRPYQSSPYICQVQVVNSCKQSGCRSHPSERPNLEAGEIWQNRYIERVTESWDWHIYKYNFSVPYTVLTLILFTDYTNVIDHDQKYLYKTSSHY